MKALAVDDPRVIGEYRLRAQLGSGGMGRVYLGLSPGGRAVAIKVVHPDLARDTEFLRRFGQEVAAARAVSGIYTAPVVASGLNENPPWLATAFVPGPALDQVVTEHGPLPEPALWPLLAGLVEALAGDTRLQRRAPRPQARQRAARHRRSPGDRLRDLPRRRRDRADGGRGGVRHARLHVTRAGRGQCRRTRERRVRARMRDHLRGHRRRPVRLRHRGGRPVPGRPRRARPGPSTTRAARDRLRLPGERPCRPARAADAGHRHRQRKARDRAVRGGLLAAAGGQHHRRLPGQARAGDEAGQPAQAQGFSWATAGIRRPRHRPRAAARERSGRSSGCPHPGPGPAGRTPGRRSRTGFGSPEPRRPGGPPRPQPQGSAVHRLSAVVRSTRVAPRLPPPQGTAGGVPARRGGTPRRWATRRRISWGGGPRLRYQAPWSPRSG